jgi:hypothetical protein
MPNALRPETRAKPRRGNLIAVSGPIAYSMI